MTLRQKVIEAGARAKHEAERTHFRPDWPTFDDLGDFGQRSAREFMAFALDAMLDCLTENALNADPPVRGGTYVDELLAVLREDR